MSNLSLENEMCHNSLSGPSEPVFTVRQQFPYSILPFRFIRISNDELILVNKVGEHLFIKSQDFNKLIRFLILKNSDIFLDLKQKHFITDSDLAPVIDMLAIKYRTKKAFLKNFTALHMIVVTVRCNCHCRYCHASSEGMEKFLWDMSASTARKVVDIIFQTPSPAVKIEFQGGEPLLNWEIVQEIVEYAEDLNKAKMKNLEFVLCTNLTLITEDMLKYLQEHNILISTSLDGPKDLHDINRVLREGGGTYDLFIEKLYLAKSILGTDRISALVTASKFSLPRFREIIDEYVRHQFQGIFLRALNPFGRAKIEHKELGYDVETFIDRYKDALEYIIDLNLKGTFFTEYYATLLLTRILTPFSTGFVDLQSPAGAGISGVIYDYDGSVYPSDEARMLAKMGDQKFLLGNVNKDSYLDIFDGRLLHEIIQKSCLEVLPGCASCAFQSYCGSNPIVNYSEQRGTIGHRPTSKFCKKNMGIIKTLFEFIRGTNDRDTDDIMDVFASWITNRSLSEIRSD